MKDHLKRIERANKFLDIQSYGALIPETRRLWIAWLVGFAEQELEACQDCGDGGSKHYKRIPRGCSVKGCGCLRYRPYGETK